MAEVTKDKTAKIVIPEGVVDEKAYLKLREEEEKLINDPLRFYYCKDADYEFDFFTAHASVLRKVEQLNVSEEEAQLIIIKSKDFIRKRGFLTKYRYAAFKKKGDPYINRNSILDHKKAELLTLFGRFYTCEEVHKIVTLQWGLNVEYSTVTRFRNNNLEAIQVEQDKYVKDWSDIKLVYKRSRLDELTELYNDRKQRYLDTKNREDYKLLLSTLEFIRKEIEGDRLTVDGGLEVNVQQTINIHVQQDVLRNINIIQFIIARVAVRMGLNPMFLMERLERSYYAKFTGFATPDNNINSDEIFYPSRELYDFNRIKLQNAVIIGEEKKAIVLPEVNEETDKIKNALLDAFLKKKKSIIESEKMILNQSSPKEKQIIVPRQKKGVVDKKSIHKKSNVKYYQKKRDDRNIKK